MDRNNRIMLGLRQALLVHYSTEDDDVYDIVESVEMNQNTGDKDKIILHYKQIVQVKSQSAQEVLFMSNWELTMCMTHKCGNCPSQVRCIKEIENATR